MKNLPVSHIMSSKLITIGPKTLMSEVAGLFDSHTIHHIPVVDNGNILGIISKSDYYKLQDHFTIFGIPAASQQNDQTFASTLASEVMTKDLIFVEPKLLISEVAKIFLENLFHAIPVVDQGNLVGIVTTYDLISYCHRELLLLSP